jgi:hypothetical protein
MPRKYNPVIKYVDYGVPNQWEEEARMEESPNGEWVRLKTFEDTTAMLIKANQRQQKELHELRAQVAELIKANPNPEEGNYA